MLAAGLAFFAFLFWSGLLTYKYYSLGYYDWDLALYSQAMWSLCHGSFEPSLFGMNFLANHSEYIAILLVPLYTLFPHPLTLITLKILSFLTGSVIIYIIAKKNLSARWALALMGLFLIYPANIFAMLHEFHFESLSIAALCLLFYYFESRKFIPFAITMIFTALIKENIPPVIMAFGLYAFFRKNTNRWLWGLIPFVFGAVVFYLSFYVVMPELRKGLASPYQYLGYYQTLGSSPFEIIKNFFIHPEKTFEILVRPRNLTYLSQLAGPLLFLPFLNHRILLIFPIFLQNLLSSSWQMQTIFFHYGAPIVPFLFFSTIYVIKGVLAGSNKKLIKVECAIMIAVFIFCLMSNSKNIYRRLAGKNFASIPAIWEMIKKIPPEAGVITTLDFDDQLSQRKHLYSFLDVARNIRGLSWRPFQFPQEVSYALVNFDNGWILDQLRSNSKTLNRIKEFYFGQDWEIVDAVQDTALLKKGRHGDLQLVEHATTPFPIARDKKTHVIDDNLTLLTYELGGDNLGRKGLLPLTFFWKSNRDVDADYKMVIIISEGQKEVAFRIRRIGYTIYPTSIWRQGDYLKERYWLYLPPLKAGYYPIQIRFYDETHNKTATIKSSGDPSKSGSILFAGNLIVK